MLHVIAPVTRLKCIAELWIFGYFIVCDDFKKNNLWSHTFASKQCNFRWKFSSFLFCVWKIVRHSHVNRSRSDGKPSKSRFFPFEIEKEVRILLIHWSIASLNKKWMKSTFLARKVQHNENCSLIALILSFKVKNHCICIHVKWPISWIDTRLIWF